MSLDYKKKQYPNILVVSNNPFSTTSNNGKTLSSYFSELPPENIAQLYFSSEIPNDIRFINYFSLSDSDILKSNFLFKRQCGRVIFPKNEESTSSVDSNSFITYLKKYSLFRIIREFIWRKKIWCNSTLDEWIDNFSPDILFFCAGDSGFAYRIVDYIKNKYKLKLIVYVTDDYILPRKTISILWWIRRNYLYRKMKSCIQVCDLFITISEQMRTTYKEIFNKNSILAVNMTDSLKEDKHEKIDENSEIALIYAGGLHFNRYKTLNLLAKAIYKYNLNNKDRKQMKLYIYSGQHPTKRELKYLNIDNASEFCGSLNSKELKLKLNQSQILVHVESFDPKSIESTKLSISTKIPEYLSLEKIILAIGPKEIASMKYLSDCAFCIVEENNILKKLEVLIEDTELQEKIKNNAINKYKRYHDKEQILHEFLDKVVNV